MSAPFRHRRLPAPWRRAARGAAVACLSAALLAACSKNPDDMVASAKSYLAKQDLNAASIQLKNALLEKTDLAEARFLLGKIHLAQGDAPSAVKELQRAADLGYSTEEITPLLARALVLTGEFDRVLKEFADKKLADPAEQANLLTAVGEANLAKANLAGARAAYEAALKANADNRLARVGLGQVKLFSGDFAGAQAEAEAVVAAAPEVAEAQSLLANVLLVQNKSDQAVAALEAAVKAQPAIPGYQFRLVSVLLSQNKLDLATEKLQALTKLAPNLPSTKYLQAFVDFRNDRLPEARANLEQVLKATPAYLPAQLLMGSIMVKQNEFILARSYLDKVLERAPNQSMARRLLVMSYMGSGEPARALEAIQPLLQATPNDPALLGLAGQVYMENGDFDKAESYLAKVVAMSPADAQARMRLGVAKLAGGDTTGAFSDLEAASGLDDKAVQADLALALTYLRRGEFDKALDAQQQLERKQPNSAQTYSLKGGILSAKEDKAGARAAFEKALSLQPDFLPAALNLARLDLQEKRPADAKGRFESIIKRNPNNADALLALADVQSRTGAPSDQVQATLERAVAATPTALPPRLALIQHFLRYGEAGKALGVAQAAVTTNPGDARAVSVLARTQMATGDHQQAISSFNKVVAMQPQSAAALIDLSDAQRQLNDLNGAEQSLRKALSLQADSLEVQQRLVDVKMARNDATEALKLARNMQQQHPDMPIGYVSEGDIQSVGAKWNDAVAAYRKAFERAKVPGVFSKLHSALVRSGKKDEADRLAQDWLRTQPKDALGRTYLAEVAMAEKRYADAASMFRSILEFAPDNALILNNLAWVSSQMKDPKAQSYAEQALAIQPDNAVVLDTLGMIEVEQGQTDKGVAHLVRAVSLAPDVPQLRLNLAKTYAKLGRKDDARKELNVLVPKLREGTPLHAEASSLLKSL